MKLVPPAAYRKKLRPLPRTCSFHVVPLAIFLVILATAEIARAQSPYGTPRLMQGLMTGAVTSTSALIWTRASGSFPVEIEYGTDPDLSEAVRSDPVEATKADDYVVTVQLDNLLPDSRYYYKVHVNSREANYLESIQPFYFDTAPAGPDRFSIRFGPCPRFQEDSVQPICKHVQRYDPDLFFWVGDNIYGDALDAEIVAEEYRRQRKVDNLLPVIRMTPQLATWDDHDRTNPMKEEALVQFRRYWANPSHGLPHVPGVFFKYRYGGVDFFFLDNRDHREPNDAPDTPQKSTLGAGQLEWLKRGLLESDAPFKVLISGGGWTKAKGSGGDSWSSFLHERDSIFAFISGNPWKGSF